MQGCQVPCCKLCVQKAFLAQVQEAAEALEHALNKSHGSHTEGIVRAVAVACVYRGLQALSNGYVMKPVAYSVVSKSLRNDSLVLGPHKRQVLGVLSALHTMTVHTAHPAYKASYNDALQQRLASEASAAALVSSILPALHVVLPCGAAMWCCHVVPCAAMCCHVLPCGAALLF